MSEDDFLSRWSRRKRAAEAETAKPPEQVAAVAPPVPVPQAEAPAVDVEKLPPLDSITSLTDVTAFLQKGVPLDLTRAALRRAWSADPSIRDFVGLAENAWDFTDPNAMPGFGPLDYSADQVKALVSEILGDTKKAAEKLAELTAEPANASNADEISLDRPDAVEPTAERERLEVASAPINGTTSGPRESNVASHNDAAGSDLPVPRSHGGALPQ